MKKITLLLLALICSVGVWAESSVIATTKALVDAATVNTATAATGWTNTVENGGIYTFGSDTYIGAATNDAVTAAFAGEGYVTVACWVYGQPTGCIFGFGEHSNGVKFYVNGQTMAMTTKGVSDFATQYDCTIKANQWNFIAYTIPGTANTSATNSRFYYTTTNDNFNNKDVSNMAATTNNQCAIGSGNSDKARESFTGTMANLTIISSDALLNNSEIAALVGAAPLKADQAYLIKNVKSGGYLSLSEAVSGEVSLQNIANCEPVYFETTTTDGAFKIKNAAESGVKYMNAWAWYATPQESTSTTWQIEQVADGIRLKASTGYLAPDATTLPVALWSDKAADNANGVYQLIEADLSYFETEFSNKIAEYEAMIGTDPGCYREDHARDIITAAQTALAEEDRTIASIQSAYNTLTEDISILDIIQPEGGKTYQIVSALPGFKAQQGVEKAMYANGDNLSWASLDELNKAYYWTLVPTAEGYTMKNCSDATKSYPGVQETTSSGYPMAEDAVDVTLTSLGSKQFTLKTTGSSNAMHCGGHSSGAGKASNVVAWDGGANSASAWYIREVEIPETAQITYQIKDGDDVIWSQVKTGKVGAAYPTPEWYYNTFVTLEGVPSETLTAGNKTVVLTANTTNVPVAMSATVEGATYYALDIHGNEAKYPLYYNTEDDTNVQVEYKASTNAEFYTDGAAKSQNYAWAFIGDAIRGFKVYNKAKGQYMVQTKDADEKVTFGDEGTLFQLYNTTDGIANSFAIKATDRNYYLNHRESYLQGWTAADAGSSFRAYAINMADAEYSVTIKEEKYSTLIVPFYTEIPEGMNVYTVASVTDGIINLTSVSDLIKPNTAYIVDGAGTYNLSNTSKSNGAGTTNYTTGLLTGVLTNGGSPIPNGSYVLATETETQKQAFYLTDGTVTCPQYKCYLTVPAGGVKALYFDNNGEETAITDLQFDNVQGTIGNGKFLENGTIVIVKNGKKYNVAGQAIK